MLSAIRGLKPLLAFACWACVTLLPTVTSAHNLSAAPVNKAANADAKALYKYLVSIYGKHILSGQQGMDSLNWVTTNVGKTPAVLGADFMDYTQSRISHGASSSEVNNAIAFAAKGGIVTFVWHWGAPSGLYLSSSEPWYSGFYTAASSFNVENAMKDTTNADYQLIVKDIDTIAVQMLKLQAAGVPVLFRALHEAEGGWFWWGAHGPEPCKKLYRLIYDRFTNTHGINNVIWVWNSINPTWYPGSDVVDIVSADAYSKGDHGPLSNNYNKLITLTGDTKMIAATEVGSIMDPAQLQSAKVDYLYYVVWGGDFISGGQWNTKDFIKSTMNSAYVLTLDKIQGWKTKKY